MQNTKIRIGRVSYLNTLPLFYKWKLPFLEIVENVPSKLAKLLELNLLEGGIVSSIHYLENQHKYILLPNISISSYGEARSVLLFSKKPLEEINSLRLSEESLTSNFLTWVIFTRFLQKRVKINNQDPDAVLVIGDKALREAKKKSYPYIFDIGQLWFEFTSLPAVFAVFVLRRDIVSLYPQEVAQLSLALMESKERFFKDLDNLPLEEELKTYLRTLDYNFGYQHSESLDLMYKLRRESFLK